MGRSIRSRSGVKSQGVRKSERQSLLPAWLREREFVKFKTDFGSFFFSAFVSCDLADTAKVLSVEGMASGLSERFGSRKSGPHLGPGHGLD